ncbi:MAG: cyclohexanone monooxygenase, partial [Nocardioidaceae bacterium]|nr:cyclohexanone monooxygenase [Nocardioidaceae bacterium]
TENGHFEVDLIVIALGFEAFTGALDIDNILHEDGDQPSDKWKRGPKTFLGLMTNGFPNLFIITGPGSPSVLANMVLSNVQHLDFAADAIAYMESRGYTRIEPTVEAQEEWSDHVAEVASKLIRKNVDNYMVHVNPDDGTRVFKPYAGGIPSFVAACEEVVKNDYKGFEFA